MDPRSFFELIDLPTDLTAKGIKDAIATNTKKIYYRGLSRTDFETAVFKSDPSDWALGHLQDHRVSISEKSARELSTASVDDVSAVLKRFLHAGKIAQAGDIIAEALGLDPIADARTLIELRKQNLNIFLALVRGRLDQVYQFVGPKKVPWHAAEAAMRLMLLYYGALELQLIAQRARAMTAFGFGVASENSGPTVGGLLTGWSEVVSAIKYAGKAAHQERPRGPTPRLVSMLEDKVRAWVAKIGKPEHELQPIVVQVYEGTFAEVMGKITKSIANWRSSASHASASISDQDNAIPVQSKGAAMKLSTLHANLTTGEQIAFASLRLENLSLHANKLIPRNPRKCDFAEFNAIDFRPGMDGPSLALYFVSQSAVAEHFATVGYNKDLRRGLQSWANQETQARATTLVKNVRSRKNALLENRTVVDPTPSVDLVGTQRWDILPDYRLRIKATSVSGPRANRQITRGNDLPAYRRKHGVYRVPERAPRA